MTSCIAGGYPLAIRRGTLRVAGAMHARAEQVLAGEQRRRHGRGELLAEREAAGRCIDSAWTRSPRTRLTPCPRKPFARSPSCSPCWRRHRGAGSHPTPPLRGANAHTRIRGTWPCHLPRIRRTARGILSASSGPEFSPSQQSGRRRNHDGNVASDRQPRASDLHLPVCDDAPGPRILARRRRGPPARRAGLAWGSQWREPTSGHVGRHAGDIGPPLRQVSGS